VAIKKSPHPVEEVFRFQCLGMKLRAAKNFLRHSMGFSEVDAFQCGGKLGRDKESEISNRDARELIQTFRACSKKPDGGLCGFLYNVVRANFFLLVGFEDRVDNLVCIEQELQDGSIWKYAKDAVQKRCRPKMRAFCHLQNKAGRTPTKTHGFDPH